MIPLWQALLLVGITGGGCWLIADSVGYWRGYEKAYRECIATLREVNNANEAFAKSVLAKCNAVLADVERSEAAERLIEETK